MWLGISSCQVLVIIFDLMSNTRE
uniref:Putative LOC100570906 [Acyrthosiphon pisum] n=1 Tax=Lepeophtheirus salmonis TaxID=72036 RepID=A0A0K2VKF0_LEPSM